MTELDRDNAGVRKPRMANALLGAVVLGAALVYPNELAAFVRDGATAANYASQLALADIFLAVPVLIWKAKHIYEDLKDSAELAKHILKSVRAGFVQASRRHEIKALCARNQMISYYV